MLNSLLMWAPYYWVIHMKANKDDLNKYSEAIDRISEGNEAMIELFNELETDDPIIAFDQEVADNIERAKKKYGDDMVNAKINTVVREMLSWLDLDGVELDDGTGGKSKDPPHQIGYQYFSSLNRIIAPDAIILVTFKAYPM